MESKNLPFSLCYVFIMYSLSKIANTYFTNFLPENFKEYAHSLIAYIFTAAANLHHFVQCLCFIINSFCSAFKLTIIFQNMARA